MAVPNNTNLYDKIPKIGITMGDIKGVGPQIILQAFANPLIYKLCTPIVFGCKYTLQQYKKIIGSSVEINTIKTWEQILPKNLNIIDCIPKHNDLDKITDDQVGLLAMSSIKMCLDFAVKGEISAVVTAPVNKSIMPADEQGLPFVGHTEYFEKQTESKSIMLLVKENLRVGLVTNHLPIKKVSEEIAYQKIVDKIKLINQVLKKEFKIMKPKIAVLGFNPHAGDEGKLGTEEKQITQAINYSNSIDIFCYGPYSADGFFGAKQYDKFDCILAMYHDQGLIPFKLLSFGEGVNYTAGIPIIRTSPDHGTAYNIVGTKKVSHQSFLNALYLALELIKNR